MINYLNTKTIKIFEMPITKKLINNNKKLKS